jgi:hypothetical protein
MKIKFAKEIEVMNRLALLNPKIKEPADVADNSYFNTVPCLGFNSGSYDLNLIRKFGLFEDTKAITKTIRKNFKYMSLTYKNVSFQDVMFYVAPGTNLEKFTRAFCGSRQKGYFPYEWLQSVSQLKKTKIPPDSAFYDKLKKEAPKDARPWCKMVWKEQGMKTMGDLLQHYCELDTKPFLEAVIKNRDFFTKFGIDLWKDAVSIPAIAEKVAYYFASKCEDKPWITENPQIFDILNKGIVGGPSIVWHRYHRRGVTKIRGGKKVCMSIRGDDANSLYPWAMAQDMPCGKLWLEDDLSIERQQEVLDQFKEGTQNGFLLCDRHVPDYLRDHFSEYCPIYKNHEVKAGLSEYMKARYPNKKRVSRKLVGSLVGDNLLVYRPQVEWDLKHGIEYSKVHAVIHADFGKPFKEFVEWGADYRRSGDADDNLRVWADCAKLILNSVYGRAAMDKTKQTTIKYCDRSKVNMHVQSFLYKSGEMIGENSFEIEKYKRTVYQNLPIAVACAVYALAKLKMAQFYYDFLDKYIDREDFQLIEGDTDSLYYALSTDTIDDAVRPELKEEFSLIRDQWLVKQDDKGKFDAYDLRTPGLFKKEHGAIAMVALCSKSYCTIGEEGELPKLSAKGTQKKRNRALLVFDNYLKALKKKARKIDMGSNSGFRMADGMMRTYACRKNSLTDYYDKRIVGSDGVSTYCPPF